jgi:hypothetical protein
MRRERLSLSPGVYLTRSGHVAIIDNLGADGRWYGSIPGSFTSTWWNDRGEHNTYSSDDIKGELFSKGAA